VITPSANTIYTVTGKGAFQCLEDTTISIDLKDCLGEATGISLQKTESSFHIFPNPSHGSFVIEAGIPGNSVEILNAVGQLIYSKALPEKETLIHTESWTSGIYFVKLYKEGKNIYTEKIVVE